MKKFKFRLQSVLDVRSLHKKIAERDLAVAQSQLNRTDKEIEENHDAWADTFKPEPSANQALWFSLANQYRDGLIKEREELEKRKDKLEEQVSIKKTTLTRKMRDEMVLQKLEEHQRNEYMREIEAKEQADIEEIDIMKRGTGE